MTVWLPSIAAAYLLGSIPFGYLLVRVVRRQDVRATGSGNIGATNVLRAGGKGLGMLTLLLDLCKGYVAVVLAMHLAARGAEGGREQLSLAAAAGIAAVLGHVFPVWLRFHGGKGVATAMGVFLALAPRAALASLGVFLLVVVLTRFVSLASIAAAAIFPVFVLLWTPSRPPMLVAAAVFIPLLILAKHHANIRRLLAGKESRFGSRKAVA